MVCVARADDGTFVLPTIEISQQPDPAVARRAAFDRARETILPKIGATSTTIDRAAIEALPQGENTPFDRLLLQLPGVSADSAASHPDFHIRNEYSNVQYRLNGLLLPDGVSGLGPILDTSFIQTLNLLTGTLPAQYGLRTSGVVDITTRDFSTPGGSVGVYGGSHGVVQPRFDYGTASGATQVYVNFSGFRSDVGIENPTPSYDPIHDRTEQGRALGYLSQVLSDSARFTLVTGATVSRFQIPDIPGLQPLGDFGGPNVNSLALNERETDKVVYNLAALQDVRGQARHAARRLHALRADPLRPRRRKRPRLRRCRLRRRAPQRPHRVPGGCRLSARCTPNDSRRLRRQRRADQQ